jgi:hypothetical protein
MSLGQIGKGHTRYRADVRRSPFSQSAVGWRDPCRMRRWHGFDCRWG